MSGGRVQHYEDDEPLTVGEAGIWLRCGRSKLYDLFRSGKLRSFREGGSRRVLAREVRAYLESTAGAD